MSRPSSTASPTRTLSTSGRPTGGGGAGARWARRAWGLLSCLPSTLIGHACPTHSLPLRFWINIIKNPQFVFDVQTSDNMDAVLLVIAQTFMDACTLADHKLGRVSGSRWTRRARLGGGGGPGPGVGSAVCAQILGLAEKVKEEG